MKDPDALVTSLVETNRALGLRAVATAQRLSDKTVAEVLQLTDDWQERSKVYRGIPDLIDDPERALALVDRLRRGTRGGNDLFFLDATVRAIDERWTEAARLVEVLRERFFDHIPAPPEELFRWVETPRDGRVELWREIPAGEGWVGSPKEDSIWRHEQRRHRVKILRPFRLAAVPVTNAQYAAFDPSFPLRKWPGVASGELAHHPVVGVTWYAAMASQRTARILSPRLVHADQASDFEKEILETLPDAAV